MRGSRTMNEEYILNVDLKLTEAERLELKRARKMPIVFDEECPETTPEMAIKFRRVNPPRDKNTPE